MSKKRRQHTLSFEEFWSNLKQLGDSPALETLKEAGLDSQELEAFILKAGEVVAKVREKRRQARIDRNESNE